MNVLPTQIFAVKTHPHPPPHPQHVGTAGLVSFLVVAAFGIILSSHRLQRDEALRLWRPQLLVGFAGAWALLWVIFSR